MNLCCFDDTVGLPIKVISVMLRSMLTGVCKLTVDAIMRALLSFINFVTSNRSLHEYNLLVMAWHCRDTLFFCNSFQNSNILNCSRVLTKSYYTN